MLDLEAEGVLERADGELRFLDLPCPSSASSSTS
jgi:hypothetical protein